MKRIAISVAVAALLTGCASALPPRYVIEHDLDGFVYRRYQKTLDVELTIRGNEATGHTATYLRRGRGKRVAITTAFVTVYERAAALAAEVHERLSALDRYQLSVQKLGSDYVLALDAGPNERWVMWVSGRHVIKLGAPVGEALPAAIAEAYLDAYPSDLDEHGHAREGTASRGPSQRERNENGEPERELPRDLRENAPR
jgi:hypothetical protein